MTTERKITFGADPEYFAVNKQGGLIPAWELGIKGTKGNPEPIAGSHCGVLVDGVAVEFNTIPRTHLADVMSDLFLGKELLCNSEQFQEKKATLSRVDSIEVQRKYQSHPGFKEIGCTPDLDAFAQDALRPVISPEDMGATRFAGGHIHIGCDPWPEWLEKRIFVQFLSAIAGEYIGNTGSNRNKYYGMPGIWRETSYGVEYRSPSTGWLRLPKNLIRSLQHKVQGILLADRDEIISELANIYNHGIMEEFRENYNNLSFAAMEFFNGWLDDALHGKHRITKPRRLVLDGYTCVDKIVRAPEENQLLRRGGYIVEPLPNRQNLNWRVQDDPVVANNLEARIREFVGENPFPDMDEPAEEDNEDGE